MSQGYYAGVVIDVGGDSLKRLVVIPIVLMLTKSTVSSLEDGFTYAMWNLLFARKFLAVENRSCLCNERR